MRYLLLLLLSGSTSLLSAQSVRKYIDSTAGTMLQEYVQFLALPNVSRDTVNLLKNAAFIEGMMQKRGIKATRLQGTTPKISPAIYGQVLTPGATRTIGFYAHYDGQPVNAEQWHKGLEPFTPVIITAPLESGGTITGPYLPGSTINSEHRISGRGSADDKAGVMAILNAYEALVKVGAALQTNIKFFFEGEEEVGSIHLDEIFKKHTQELTADVWIIIDGPRHVSGRKTVSFGVRGDVNVNLTVYGAKRPLHSGNYGNWAPNPAQSLVQLLSSMKGKDGRVTIKDFYKDVTPLSTLEKTAIDNLPRIDEVLKQELGLAQEEMPGVPLAAALMQPTLNINGMSSGNVGALASNVIPVKAEAVLDLRLVKGNDWKVQVQKVVNHIKAEGFHVLDREPTGVERLQFSKLIKVEVEHGYNAQRTSMDLPVSRMVGAAVQSTTKDSLVLIPSSGGSLPLYLFEELLRTPVITVPIVNYDNNQHAENENVRISYLWEGIETIAAIMMMKYR